VNIITSKRTRGAWSASAHGYYESVGEYTGDARVGTFIGDTRLWLAGGRTLFTGFSNPDTSRAKRWNPREQTTFDADITHFLGAHTIGASASLMDDYILNRGTPRSPYRETAFDDTYRTRRISTRLLAQGEFDEKSYEISAAFSDYVRRKNSYLKNLVTLGENDTSTADAWNIRARMNGRLPFGPLGWEAGGDATIERLTGGRIINGDQDGGDYAVYARLEYTPSSVLSVQPGVRITHNTRYAAPIVPSLHVKISPDTSLVIRASYGRGFRAPSLRDLYFVFVDINHNIIGNPDLRAETSHNINAGVTYTQHSPTMVFEASASGYYNNVRNLITLVADTGDLYIYRNIGAVRTIGGTISPMLRWERGTARIGVSLTGASSDLSDRPDVPSFTLTPELGAESRWRILDDVELAADYKYTARVPYYTLGAADVIERRFSDDYHLLNSSVAYTFAGGKATVRAGVRNIFGVTDITLGGVSDAVHSDGSATIPVAWGRSFIFDLQLRVP
jgi:outer membrane receptor for ferrienterochelin and colicins